LNEYTYALLCDLNNLDLRARHRNNQILASSDPSSTFAMMQGLI
jgi:hypothetical protein